MHTMTSLSVFGFIISQLATVQVSGYTLADYFPEIKNDLTKVTWVHAVNSKEKLESALKGDALMLEADILMGHISEESKKANEPFRPIMAHPPNTISDLTLEEFINTVIERKHNKGIKLDFKTREAFAYSATIIDKLFMDYTVDFPIWLNADIIPGPINGTREVVDPDYFLSTCISRYPTATISVGWSTRLEKGSTEGSYLQDDINRMTDALNKNRVIVGPVTFAVRAAFAARSVDILTNLIKSSATESTTLTIWSSDDNDAVDVKGLRQLIHNVGKHSVYLDLPEELLMKVIADNTPGSSGATFPSLSLLSIITVLFLAFL